MIDAEARQRALTLAQAADGLKAVDLLLLEVGELTLLADYFLLCTGTSDRHVRALADRLQEAGREIGMRRLHVEGLNKARWILIDFGEVVAHILTAEAREHYGFESLWADAPRVAIDLVA